MMFNEFGKKPPQFGDALTVADEILNSGLEFDKGILVYNRFRYAYLTVANEDLFL